MRTRAAAHQPAHTAKTTPTSSRGFAAAVMSGDSSLHAVHADAPRSPDPREQRMRMSIAGEVSIGAVVAYGNAMSFRAPVQAAFGVWILMSSACVSSGKYDAAVKNADDARAALMGARIHRHLGNLAEMRRFADGIDEARLMASSPARTKSRRLTTPACRAGAAQASRPAPSRSPRPPGRPAATSRSQAAAA